MVARGYAVLLPDPALSTGYGQEAIQRGWGRWGATPFTDLMAITDAACARADIDEGADMVMVKPGLPCLDVIHAVREAVDVPVVAYQVSGEFAMLHASAERGWIDLPRAMQESAIALKRAGADVLITYFARELAAGLAAGRATAAVMEPVR